LSQSISIIEQRIAAGSQFDGSSGASTGTITTVAGSALVADEAFFLRDKLSAEVEFRFVSTAVGFATSPILRPVVFAGGDSADTIRDKLIVAINAARALNIVAADGGAATVDLEHRLGGVSGNATPTVDTVVDGTFAVTAMAGGVDRSYIDELGTRVFDTQTAGGQFDFPLSIPQSIPYGTPAIGGVLTWLVDRVVITGDATSYTVRLMLPDGTTVTLATDTTGDAVVGPFTLGGDERLQVITAGGTAAKVCRVLARPGIQLPYSMLAS
jgi:hypothetical protein